MLGLDHPRSAREKTIHSIEDFFKLIDKYVGGEGMGESYPNSIQEPQNRALFGANSGFFVLVRWAPVVLFGGVSGHSPHAGGVCAATVSWHPPL